MQPAGNSAVPTLETAAEAAIRLLAQLEQSQDSAEPVWRGEDALETLQTTARVVAALASLGLGGITDPWAQPALDWLEALPAEQRSTLRLHPARFQALAEAGRFGPGPASDFAEFSQTSEVSPDFGSLDVQAALAWLDAALRFADWGVLDADGHGRLDAALNLASARLGDWLAHPLASPAGLIEAALALDALVRAGRLPTDSPEAEQARNAVVAALATREPGWTLTPVLLFVAIRLRSRFADDPGVLQAATGLLAEVAARVHSGEYRRAGPTWQALALQLLGVHHGPALREAVLEALWARRRETARVRERQEQERLEAELAALVRQSIHIDLSPPQRITGTRSRGELYRLRFGLTTEAASESGSHLTAPAESLRLIVKKGAPEALARAIRRYGELPEALKALFARHAENRGSLNIPPGYLLMQDLAGMQPLSEVLAGFDGAALGPAERGRLGRAAQAVGALLRALHGAERRRSPVGQQFTVLYLAPMIQSLSRLAQPAGFPEMAAWLERGAIVNGRALGPFDGYAARLAQFEARLRAPALGYVHGDCHSRNIMLDGELASARLVDIETLAANDDYATDYGLLLEDLAVYQSLPYGDEPGRLRWDEIEVDSFEAESGPAAQVRYPAFPPGSAAGVLFQRLLLGQIAAFAAEVDDPGWQERLWLAVVRGLLLLAGRQLASQPIHPYRRAESIKLAQAATGEALRLLDELTAHLEGREPLPAVPFAGWPTADG